MDPVGDETSPQDEGSIMRTDPHIYIYIYIYDNNKRIYSINKFT